MIEKISEFFQKIETGVDFIEDDDNREAIKLIWEKLKSLIRHYKPRSFKGKLNVGLDDPAATGQLLGAFYGLYPKMFRDFDLTGDFTGENIEGSVSLKGHIRLNHLAWALLVLYFNRTIRSWMKRKED